MNRKYVKEVYDDYILDIYGNKYYYKDNFAHKAISKSGSVYYFNELGQLHRLDGPACEYVDGHKAYYIDGDYYSYVDWCKKVKEYE